MVVANAGSAGRGASAPLALRGGPLPHVIFGMMAAQRGRASAPLRVSPLTQGTGIGSIGLRAVLGGSDWVGRVEATVGPHCLLAFVAPNG